MCTWEFHIRKIPTIQFLKIKTFNLKNKKTVTSIIKICYHIILSGYWEHYPRGVNYATVLVNSMSLEISSATTLTIYATTLTP